jgi:hypothetical protein
MKTLLILTFTLLCSIPSLAFAEVVTPATTRTTVGTFVGIEEGDYAHWLMRTAEGDELSLFILHPDSATEKVLEKPESYVGRRCRVEWKESMEDIPESGGMVLLQQILRLEWLQKD